MKAISNARVVGQGACELCFTRYAEIIDLTGDVTRGGLIARAALGVDSPAIGPNCGGAAVGTPLAIDANNQGTGYTAGLIEALRKGGCWVNLHHSSNMPMVGLVDAADASLDLAFVEHNPTIMWFGHGPRFVDRPMLKPLLVPGLARYYWNHRDIQDLWELCGETSDSNLTPTTGLTAFYVTIEYARVKQYETSQRNKPQIILRLPAATVHAAQDSATMRHAMWPTFVFPPGKGQYAQVAQGWANCAVGQWRLYCGVQGIGSGPTTLPFALTNWTDWVGKRVGNKVWFYLDMQSDGVDDGTLDADSMLSVTANEV